MTAEQIAAAPHVGEIFVYTWGWEQTNVEFYEVVEVGQTPWRAPGVMIRHIASHFEKNDRTRYSVVPVPGQYTERPVPGQHTAAPCWRAWSVDGPRVYISLHAHRAWPWDGRPVYGSRDI